MQELRKVLTLAGAELPPVAEPRSFEAEGEALRTGFVCLFLHFASKVEDLKKAVEGMRIFMRAGEDGGAYPNALITLNRAIQSLTHEEGAAIMLRQAMERAPALPARETPARDRPRAR